MFESLTATNHSISLSKFLHLQSENLPYRAMKEIKNRHK